jgi:hypothetical protein
MAKRKEQQLESTSLFLAVKNVPTEIVESKYFRAMLESFDANADPPSINKVKDHFRGLGSQHQAGSVDYYNWWLCDV